MNPFYSLGFLLNRTSVSLSKALNVKLETEKIDLPHSQFIALRCLYYNDGISQQEMARLLSKDAAAIKRTIDNLENKGLIIRNQTSLRENSLEITSEGKQLMPIVLRYADQVLKESLNGIDNLKYDELVSMLNQIYDNTKKSK